MNDRRTFLTAGTALLAAATLPRAVNAAPPGGNARRFVYLHGLAWNPELPGPAGELLLTFDLEVDLETGTGFGTASDSIQPAANVQFAITAARKDGGISELQGVVIRANDPANLGLPVSVKAVPPEKTSLLEIRLGDLVFKGGRVAPADHHDAQSVNQPAPPNRGTGEHDEVSFDVSELPPRWVTR